MQLKPLVVITGTAALVNVEARIYTMRRRNSIRLIILGRINRLWRVHQSLTVLV